MATISSQSSLTSRLADLLGVERGERATLSLMVMLNFVISIAYVLVQTTAFGLFVGEYGSQNLPYAYLIVAVLASSVAYGYLKLSERVSFRAAQYANLAFLIVACLVFWVGLRSSEAHWFIFLLPFWFQALVNLANLIIWHSASHLYNVRQAKRLFGLIGAGNWIANIAGGLVVASILTAEGAANLYLLAALALAASAVVLRPILNSLSATSTPSGGRVTAAARRAAPASSPLRHPYSRLIFVHTLLWWLAFFVIDNIFYDRAGAEFASADQLASFIGKQLSVMGVIAIITTSFLTSRIVGKYGLRTALLVMPLIVTVCALLIVVGGALGWTTVVLFWLAALAKTLNVALGFSLSLAAGTLLYQPLQGSVRSATQTIAEGIVQPVAIGLAGVLLLVFNTLLHFNAVGLSYLYLVIAGFWLWSIVRISRAYPKVLSDALHKRNLGETTNVLFDPAGLAQLRSSLHSPRAAVALYAFNQLEQLEPHAWRKTFVDAMPALLAHPAREVRQEALRRVLAFRLKDAIPLVRGRLREESAPDVISTLFRVLAALGDVESEPQVIDAVGSPDRTVRQGAIVGSLASGSPRLTALAEAALQGLVGSDSAADRALAAEILAEANFARTAEILSALIADREPMVRKAAIIAAGGRDEPAVLTKIVNACDDRETAGVAEGVLVSKGSESVGAIAEGLRAAPRQRLESLVRVLGRIPNAKAVELLRSQMDSEDPDIRLQVLRSLSLQTFRATPHDRIPDRVSAEIASAAWIAGAIQSVDDAGMQSALLLLRGALETAFGEARTRVLLLLSFIYDPKAMLRAEQALHEAGGQRTAFAAETVDAQLSSRLKPRVMPLMEDISQPHLLAQWKSAGVQVRVPALDALLVTLMGRHVDREYSVWLRMCAIHAAGVLGMTACEPALQELRTVSDPRLRQTSEWSLGRLGSDRVAQGENQMLSLVEKVLILKSARLFSETPDKVLADIADFADEIDVDKDEVVFNKDEAGDSLYIIVTGAVEAIDGDRILNRLGEGDIFGELALLDPEPRLATIRATEPTHLLRLDETSFKTILAERPEVSSAIIRVITRYLRSLLRGAGAFDGSLTPSQPSGNPDRAPGVPA